MALCLLLALFLTGCDGRVPPAGVNTLSNTAGSLSAVVLYCSEGQDDSWQDVYSHLDQSLLLGLAASTFDVAQGIDLTGVDIVYADESIMSARNAADIAVALMAFTEAGGAVFLTNGFRDYFPQDYLGAADFVKIKACPTGLSFPAVGSDLGELQEIVADFAALYERFPDYALVSHYDYGYGVKVSTAIPLVECGSLALYTMNRYGDGYVFFTNPLLPNDYAITGFSLESRDDRQVSLSNTTASGNQLLENGFASYISKQRYGYSLYRVFGSFGRPSMAWELHYEEITGIENGSAIIFGELCKAYGQVPSYTLIRNAYWWFMRAETVSYLLGESADELSYAMDYYENSYSSGTHVAAGGEWLALARMEDTASYFVDDGYRQRLYPYLADLDGDGDIDLLCGSSDGKFYYYAGQGFKDRLITAEAVAVTDGDGRALLVEAYSAPVLADVNGNGILDLITGCVDGKVYWFSGNGDLTFAYEGLLCNGKVSGQSLPAVGDLDGDGCPDLVVGSDSSELSVWYGSAAGSLSVGRNVHPVTMPEELGAWLAPRIVDLNGDGVNDLAIGTAGGYIARLLNRGGSFQWDGYIAVSEMNYKGNDNAKFGYNCAPFFADINGDGMTDLLAGHLEYGLAYPIDSNYFPYDDELQETVDYIVDNEFYLGVHFYTNQYASAERERAELAYHIAAMKERYGVDLDVTGTNHHTWYCSSQEFKQSLLSVWHSGLLWDSGFSPAGNSGTAPQINAQNVISLPFFMTQEGEKTLLLQNCSTLLYGDPSWSDISAKYGMPMCLYYHCDFAYEDEAEQREYIEAAEDFRRQHVYNFTLEDQMMLATAASYNLAVAVAPLKDGWGFTVTPSAVATDFALYNEGYQNSGGLRLSLGESLQDKQLSVDADVWYVDGHEIYVALNRPITVTEGERSGAHLRQINIAAEVETTNSGASIRFLDGGMMQITVEGPATTDSAGWDVQTYDGLTVFTKYGEADKIMINYN